MANKIQEIYNWFLNEYGFQGWWPLIDCKGCNPTKTGSIKGYHPKDYSYPKNEKQRFEISIGAILTQNTAWPNVEKALLNLKKISCIDPKKILSLNNKKLKNAIKPAGYFNQKAKKLKIFSEFYLDLKGKTPSREELLDVWGIGPETADSILLYAYKIPSFVVDAYTKRIFTNLKLIKSDQSYDEIKELVENNLKKDFRLYQEFHALLVEHAKRFYNKKEFYNNCHYAKGFYSQNTWTIKGDMMNKLIALSFLVLIILGCQAINPKTQDSSSKKSEVRMVDNMPTLFVDGKELSPKVFTQVYYHPDASLGTDMARYGETRWVTRLKETIDTAKDNGAKIVNIKIWWSDFDSSSSRPSDLSKALNFEPLDEIMDYASEKGIYIMFFLVPDHNIPEWWKKENHFPGTWYNRKDISENERCDCCETDALGTSYANPGFGCELIHQDYGNFLKYFIARYKTKPAFIGWSFGIGPTGEDSYGPSYVLMNEQGDHVKEKIKDSPERMADFSPSVSRDLKAWLLEKYKTDSRLQEAWNDSSVSFSSFSIPPIEELFVNSPNSHLAQCDSSEFTAKGKDFCDFKEKQMTEERDFFINLFAENDQNHILVWNGITNRKDILQQKKEIDAVIWNPNYAYYQVTWGSNEQFFEEVKNVEKIISSNKLAFVAAETLHYQEGAEKLNYLEWLGKAIICAGGWSGYDSDLFGDESVKRTVPTWYTTDEMAVVKKISSYKKTADCKCNTIKEVYTKNNCQGHIYKQGEGKCSLLTRAYSEFCGDTATTSSQSVSSDEKIGVIGCSITLNALNGYSNLGGTKLWSVSDLARQGSSGYAGGSLAAWYAELNTGGRWNTFQSMMKKYPETNKIWWELCSSEESTQLSYSDVVSIYDKIKAIAPNAELYVSASPNFPGESTLMCNANNGHETMQGFVDNLVSDGKVKQGPELTELKSSEVATDGCHALRGSGEEVWGQDLIDFFGKGSSQASSDIDLIDNQQNNQNHQTNNVEKQPGTSPCGDGTCDNFEKSTGMCPEDCG
jgi:endonuclease-3 related protein